ncbi:MAG: hypothetical protein ACI9XO_005027 [Paraglaciecola sp.]
MVNLSIKDTPRAAAGSAEDGVLEKNGFKTIFFQNALCFSNQAVKN